MKIPMTGGSGFVGTQLTSRFIQDGNEVTILTRSEKRPGRGTAGVLGKVLHRPSLIPAPGFIVKLVLGEFRSVILEGQRVLPRRLLENGFVFQYPDVEKALQSIVGQ